MHQHELYHKPDHESDHPPAHTVMPPTAELLLEPAQATSLLGEQNPDVVRAQLELHANRVAAIDAALDNLPRPTTRLMDAVHAGAVGPDQAAVAYQALSDLLDDPDFERLALYVPFELMPGQTGSFPVVDGLQTAAQRFTDSYRQAWYSLLGSHDVRTSFTDGDMPEGATEAGTMQRVVKAAHLAPELVAAGMLEYSEVTALYRSASDDPVLRRSLEEALAAIHGYSLQDATAVPMTATALPETEARRAWLAGQADEASIALSAARLMVDITAARGDELARADPRAVIDAIYATIEQAMISGDPATAKAVYAGQRDALRGFETNQSPEISKHLARAYRRLYRLGLTDEADLQRSNIDLPDPKLLPSANLELLSSETEAVRRLTEAIAADPELSGLVYPIALFGGSRLKGYGEADSDVDVAVFVRPGVSDEPQSRQRLRGSLWQVGAASGVLSDPTEYWLQAETDGSLTVRDIPDADWHMADQYWTHMLFGAAWVGGQREVSQLQQQLLPAYFAGADSSKFGQPERSLYLQRIEQDILQFRLMHKGYARHYPLYMDRHQASSEIDGSSVFWDPGYRQLATRLFVRHVFLPKV